MRTPLDQGERSDVTFSNAFRTIIDTSIFTMHIPLLEIGGRQPKRTSLRINYISFPNTKRSQYAATLEIIMFASAIVQ